LKTSRRKRIPVTFRRNSAFHVDEELQEHYRRTRDKALDQEPAPEPIEKTAEYKEAAVDILSAAQSHIGDGEYDVAMELIEQAKNLL
jgi:hypothetical protein